MALAELDKRPAVRKTTHRSHQEGDLGSESEHKIEMSIIAITHNCFPEKILPNAYAALSIFVLATLASAGIAWATDSSGRPDLTSEGNTQSVENAPGDLEKRIVCKITGPRIEFAVVTGEPPPGWDQPRKEWVEFPPESTPELDQLATEEVRARVNELLPKLGNETFDIREQATLRLMQLGLRVCPLIKDLQPKDPEIFARVARIRNALEAAKEAGNQLILVNGQCEWRLPY